jgi:hypothetical protein
MLTFFFKHIQQRTNKFERLQCGLNHIEKDEPGRKREFRAGGGGGGPRRGAQKDNRRPKKKTQNLTLQ